MKNGADVNATCTYDGTTPLHIAKKNNHGEIVLAIIKQSLVNYSAKTNKRADDHYKTSLTIFGRKFNFGYSAKQKKEAAAALQRVIEGHDEASSLKSHQKVLNNGELKSIYQAFQYRSSY